MSKQRQQQVRQEKNYIDSSDAEKVVLSVLINNPSSVQEVVEFLKAEMFNNLNNQYIYQAILSLYDNDRQINMSTVFMELQRIGDFDISNNGDYFASVALVATAGISVREHAFYISECHTRRTLNNIAASASHLCHDFTKDVGETMEQTLTEIETLSTGQEIKGEAKDVYDVARRSLDEYQIRKKNRINGIVSGVNTGFKTLNKITGGFRPNQLLIVAARPAMGKTALLIHFALNAAATGSAVVIFSLEMGDISLADRMIISLANVDANKYKNGWLSNEEEMRVCDAIDKMSKLKIKIVDNPLMSIRKIKSVAKKLKRLNQCDIVMIDYLQLIDMRADNKSYNREQEVSACSRNSKLMAKELQIPVIMLSQLSRESEKRADKVPMLSDLRESGAIEQDADTVIFIHREEYYSDDAEVGKGLLSIAKQRDGATGDIDFSYNSSLTRLADYGELNEMPF